MLLEMFRICMIRYSFRFKTTIMIITSDKTILYIEPKQDESKNPIIDSYTINMFKQYKH